MFHITFPIWSAPSSYGNTPVPAVLWGLYLQMGLHFKLFPQETTKDIWLLSCHIKFSISSLLFQAIACADLAMPHQFPWLIKICFDSMCHSEFRSEFGRVAMDFGDISWCSQVVWVQLWVFSSFYLFFFVLSFFSLFLTFLCHLFLLFIFLFLPRCWLPGDNEVFLSKFSTLHLL